MKIRRPALATTTVSAAVLALALAAPGTAVADDTPDKGNKGGASAKHAQDDDDRDETPEHEAPEVDDAHDEKGDTDDTDDTADTDDEMDADDAPAPAAEQDAGAGSSGSGKSDAAPAGKDKAAAKGRSESAPAGKQQGSQAAKGAGDPGGNNGTIKISSLPVGAGKGNQPHPGCSFALVHYGFDAGQTADITFTHKAPTGSGETLLTRRAVLISDDAAGGGQDRDAVLTFTAADLGLTGTAPHRKGWHVKVAVDALEAPGGAKQKVFWLDCPGGTGTGGTGTGGTGGTGTDGTGTGGTGTGGTGTGGTDTGGTGGTGTGGTGTSTGGASSGSTEVLAGSLVRPLATSLIGTTGMTSRTDTAAGVLSSSLTRNAATAAQAPAGSSALPSVLPFTGAGTIAFLFSLAVLALAAGGAFLRAGSRRAVQ